MNNSLVLFNGSIFTSDRDQPWAEAIAIRDGSIEAVGSDASIRRPGTEEIDLDGRTVVPGFIDAHNHYLATGEMLANVDVKYPKVASIDDLVDAIARAAADTPAGEWINATGFDHARSSSRTCPRRMPRPATSGAGTVTTTSRSRSAPHFPKRDSRHNPARTIVSAITDASQAGLAPPGHSVNALAIPQIASKATSKSSERVSNCPATKRITADKSRVRAPGQTGQQVNGISRGECQGGHASRLERKMPVAWGLSG